MDRAELTERIETLHPDSFGWALACCRHDVAEAEDVLQATYLLVLDGRAQFEGRSSFKTWLFGVIRRTAIAARRRALLRTLLLDRNRPALDPTPAVGPEDAAIDADRVARLRSALNQLTDRQRGMLELVFYHDLTVEDAAAVLGVSVGTARTHYDRGKKRMAALLNGDLR